ncbi:MAG: hypothetical protein IJU76_00390 [Desulfovibrionaceae bacterium]|nr:hypothetical protein [Desulfovibrionaceae bacterium]
MRGLFLHLSPFAPDQSGVVSVLYEMGGLLVVCDAGGCTGNICGFDEPRWKTKACALFSAGLRDMDAILGRDDRLVERTVAAAKDLNPAFVALIGTPVPCVIGTDFTGIARMAEKRLHCPVLPFDTTGTALYDKGAAAAYLSLCKTFTSGPRKPVRGSLAVFGANPLDVGSHTDDLLHSLARETKSEQIKLIGLGSGLDALKAAPHCERVLVLAPSGLPAARYLESVYGTPYTIGYPMTPPLLEALERVRTLRPKNILLIHQHVLAESLKAKILADTPETSVTCATFFSLLPGTDGLALSDEESFVRCVEKGAYDCVIGDAALARAVAHRSAAWIDIPHFAVSSRD